MTALIKSIFLVATIGTLIILVLIVSGYTQTTDRNIIQQVVGQLRVEEVEQSMEGLEKSFSSGSISDFFSNTSKLVQRKFIITQLDTSQPIVGQASTMIAHVRYFEQDNNGLGEELNRYFYFLHDIEHGWKISGISNAKQYWMNFLFNQQLSQKTSAIIDPGNPQTTSF